MQKFFKSEVGRSMVEMLGVLAIIGVLSIASIAGYSYAVTKWKAGEVLSDLHTRAIEYTRQMAMQKKFAPDFQFKNFELGDENSLGNPVAGYPLYDDPDFFEIEVRGVSAEVCEQIIRDKAHPVIDIAINDDSYGALEEDCRVETPGNLVTMTFLFYKTLEGVEVTLVYEGTPICPEGEDVVGYYDENGHYKETCCPLTSSDYAWEEEKCCASGEWASNGHCCARGTYWAEAEQKCCASGQSASNGHCCPSSSGGWAEAENKCCASTEYNYGGHCCAKNSSNGGWGLNVERCCTSEEKHSWAYDTEGKEQSYCCPSASEGWGLNVERCCTTEEKRSYAYNSEGKEQSYCCPSASDGWGVNVNRCCDAAQGEKRYYNYDSSINHWNYFCCPKNGGTGGWGSNVQRCCTAEETRVYDNQYGHYHCCPTGQTWDSTTERCVGGNTTQCTTNDDCLANEFCNLKNATSCTVKPTTGVCQAATVSHTKTINGVTYKRSSDYMNWWSAENFCARIGGSLASVSDFQCGYNFVGNKKTGYCNADTSTSSGGTRSDTMKEFMSGLGSDYVWTDDDYSACNVYHVGLFDGRVYDRNRGNIDYALCRVGGA